MQTITLKGYGTNIPPYEAIELGTYDSYGVEQLQIVPSHGWENLSIIAEVETLAQEYYDALDAETVQDGNATEAGEPYESV